MLASPARMLMIFTDRAMQGLQSINNLKLGSVVGWSNAAKIHGASYTLTVLGFGINSNDLSKPDAKAVYSCTDTTASPLPASLCKA